MTRFQKPVIYESDYPVPFLPSISLFEYIFPSEPAISVFPQGSFDPSLPAFIDGLSGRTLTRAQLEDSALRAASGLKKLGLKRGDTACIWSPNSIEWAIAGYSLFAAGITGSPANAAYEPHEIAHQLNDSGSQLIFICPSLLPKFERARKELKFSFPAERVILLTPPDAKPSNTPYKPIQSLFGDRSTPERFDGTEAHATAWLCYSSGTTGLPKGVQTSHHNFTTQLQTQMICYEQLKVGDKILGFLPLSHVYGSVFMLVEPLSLGCATVLLPRFEEIAVLTALEKYRIRHALFVPPIILRFLHSENVPKFDLSALKTVQSAAAPLQTDLCSAFEKRLGVTVIQGYGMTETSPGVAAMNSSDAPGRSGWVGRLMPTYQARLVDDDGNDAPVGGPGELWVRSPNIMKGYHKNPAANADSFAPGAWFKTGDILIVDKEGWWKVVDRKKELIKYKGFQVAPAELEDMLVNHPEIVDCGVIGIYDESQASELPRAYVVPRNMPGTHETKAKLSQTIIDWVAGKVANHKRLRGGVHLVEAVPKSPSGKILRKDLRKMAEADPDLPPKAKL